MIRYNDDGMLSEPFQDWDNMWSIMDALFNYTGPKDDNSVSKKGLKSIIRPPHNLYTIKDDKGNVISNVIKVVITPFQRKDVKVSVDGNLLTVKCGAENKVDADDRFLVYRGISSQSYHFSLKLSDNIDKKKITAKIDEGVLTVTMPFVQKEEKPKTSLDIEIA